MACSDVTKTLLFQQKKQRDFDEICPVDVQLMQDKVPQISCRYLQRFGSYREMVSLKLLWYNESEKWQKKYIRFNFEILKIPLKGLSGFRN